MDEQRQQDYLNLIQALLNCPSGEENNLLTAHQNLIDEGLLQVMEQVAAWLAQQGDGNRAEFLKDVSRQLAAYVSNSANAVPAEEYIVFLVEVLQATADSNRNPEVVYPILAANQHKLNDTLAELYAHCGTEVLSQLEPENALGHAAVFIDFSYLIMHFSLGNRSSNLEIAIVGYHLALRVFNREAFPQYWARTQNNLGNAYSDRIKGDKAENLEKAIACYKQALLEYTREAFPQDWAMTQNNLGNAYRERIKGDKAQNLEKAIACYEQALLEYTRKAFPQDWAMTQNNLGNAYRERIKEDKAQNLEKAIACCEQALLEYTREAFPQEWAGTNNNLGIAYRERIKGDKAQNLEKAIGCFEQALLVRTHEAFPQDLAMIQNNLGAAYSDRIKGDKRENLELAIECYRQALLVYTRDSFPQEWAQTQNNLGAAYSNRIKGDKAENGEKAIACFEQALLVRTREAFAQDWGMTQNNLGAAYRERIKGDKAQNLEKAIACYEQALLKYTREAFPQSWAVAQNNLGIAYSDRIKGDKAQNLEKALACCEQALQVYTREAFPQEWAGTNNNLGTAYRERIKGDKAQNLEKAIACYEQALLEYTREAFPQEWAVAQNNLGIAYRERIKGDKAQNLEKAIACCEQALQVYTREAFPQEWAGTNNNLGTAYRERIKGDKAQNLEKAIACCEQALQVYTREAFPQSWAGTQNNLGGAYQKRGQIEEAIQCYQSALEIYTPATFPLECLRTGRNLGNVAFTAGRWREAIQGYAAAIEAVEESRSQAMTDERRQEIIRESIDIYEKMVQACINTDQFDKAFEYAERSRSKHLVDLMASQDLYASGEIPPEVERLLQAFQQKQQQIDQLRGYNNPSSERAMGGASRSRAKFEETNAEILALEEERQQLWQQLRSLDPVLAGQIKVAPPDIAALQQLLDDERSAILSFYTTDSDTYIFILRKNQIDCHICAGQGRNALQVWIIDNWLIPYLSDRTEWIKQMSGFLGELANRLNLNDLIANHLQGIDELILVPHFYLHLIPFAAMPISDKGKSEQFLGDKFLIRHVPSCQVWEFCQKRPRLDSQLDYGIAENTREDLHFSSFECQQVAELYQVSPERRLQGRRKATVAEYRRLVKQVQGILSSHHAQSRLDNSLESVLVLGDGFITLGDLLTPGWRLPQLVDVFLSCCETAMGDTTLTDDILTIAFGFLCAGARSVVSTLWAVDDLATALFSLFYHQHKRNFSRPLALRKAQEDLRTLSGSRLETEYKQAISDLLKDQHDRTVEELKQAYAARKQAKKQQFPDAVKFWEKEYLFFSKKREKLEVAEKCLERACAEAFPFSDPYYWSAFICQGVR